MNRRIDVAFALALLAACARSHVVTEMDAGPRDGGRCVAGGAVDLLIVMQDSGSILEEQMAILRDLSVLFDVLGKGDVEPDGIPDFPPVADVRSAVVSTDLGAAGYAPGGRCFADDPGDDAVFTTTSWRCPSFPPIQTFVPGTTESIADLQCAAELGETTGCALTQPLEAMLKALLPSTSPLRFLVAGSPTGNGDGVNSGFLRPDSLLAVLIVNTRDDCAAADPRVFDPDDTTYDRWELCGCCPEGRYSPDRYIDALVSLRPSGLDHVLVAGIVGVPERLLPQPLSDDDPDYDAILADPSMAHEDRPFPDGFSCYSPGIVAEPPPRIVEVLKRLGRAGMVKSICRPTLDYTPALRAFGRRILERSCLR